MKEKTKLKPGYPAEIRGAGPQPEDYATFDEWADARRARVFARMMIERPEPEPTTRKNE